ncbi:protein-disulfide reductase DsbD N-terminal domain-containing protein [Psychrobacter urativorans]|uniref:protein-disulfide reductase DsbD N-terminal domain-containing protein n=1 Tax=Psychrobacter urativorans TaxID=45610 RepID=UPI00191ADA06|nr:protein-disulfide reductase DsbD N-terminal domain-containing protein [Psychrobacter urativorans]
MSIKTPLTLSASNKLTSKSTSKKSHIFALALASISLFTGLMATSMTGQAAGLNDLFGNSQSSASKFLSVDQAFQVSSSSKATSTGTRFSINFDITPGHYVYKDQLTLSFPKGVRATPFTFSQSPVSINDPTFGKVPVFTQRNVVATTTLTSTNGKPIKNAAVVIGWQGCAKAGLCYPPEKIKTTVNVAATRK